MSAEYGRYRIVKFIETNGFVGTEESIRYGGVLEESTVTCDGQVKLAIGDTSIYEEEEWKYAFRVCSKITGETNENSGLVAMEFWIL